MGTPTKQFRKRNAILECLRNTDIHPSAETLYAMLQKENPDISLATVYRNLARFKNEGVITSIGAVNGIERFDAITEPHVHFVCSCCESVVDLPQMENNEMSEALADNGTVDITGFGKFVLFFRKARMGINPVTKDRMEIPSSRLPKFKPSQTLKNKCNNK